VSGEQCQLPFIFRGLERTGCIRDSDPAGLLWCSTRLDSQGRHVAGGGHWDHCQPGCPQHTQTNTTQASQASSELRVEMEEPLCFTLAGEEGKCRLAASCIGSTISQLETNNCELSDGTQGTCCVSISTDNVINIIDTPLETVALPAVSTLNRRTTSSSGPASARRTTGSGSPARSRLRTLRSTRTLLMIQHQPTSISDSTLPGKTS